MPFPSIRRVVASVVLVAVAAACSGDDPSDGSAATAEAGPAWVGDVLLAVEAVEAELGAGQEYFEVTATPQLTNVFVAVDDATAAIPFLFVDGMLEEPAPRLDGAAGQTFTAVAIEFDPATVLSGVEAELPDATIDSFSVEGGPGGAVRYVVSARSAQGGVLDVEVGPTGQVFAVDPL